MATIVTNQQSHYSPLLQQLAGAFLMPALSRLSNQIFGGDTQRKESAFIGEAARASQMRQPQREMDYSMSTPLMDKFSRIGSGETQYEGDLAPWRNTMQPFSPLEQFDRAVANGGRGGTPVTGVGTASLPDIRDFIGNLDMKRFGMIPADRMMELANPYFEAARKEYERQRVQDFINNDFDSSDMDQLLKLQLIGGIDHATFGHMAGYNEGMYKHNNPQSQFGTIDLGDRETPYFFTPTPGNPNLRMLETIAKGQTPESKASTALGYAGIAAANTRNANNIAARKELAALETKRRFTGAPFIDANGSVWQSDDYTGKWTQVPGVQGTPKQQAMDPFFRLEITGLNNEIRSVQTQIAALSRRARMRNKEQISVLEEQLAQLKKERASMIAIERGDQPEQVVRDIGDTGAPSQESQQITEENLKRWAEQNNLSLEQARHEAQRQGISIITSGNIK